MIPARLIPFLLPSEDSQNAFTLSRTPHFGPAYVDSRYVFNGQFTTSSFNGTITTQTHQPSITKEVST